MSNPTPAPHLYVRGALRRQVNKKPAGDFTVESGGKVAQVLEVIDVSGSGIRLQISRPLQVPGQVILRYQTGDMNFQLHGVLCWESRADGKPDEIRMIGVEVMSPGMLANLL